MQKTAIFLDYNAGGALSPEVQEQFKDFQDSFGGFLPNPSSIHSLGRLSRRVLSETREAVARSLGKNIATEQIIFTSCGSEANQTAIRSGLLSSKKLEGEITWLYSAVEHDSVLKMREWAAREGTDHQALSVDPQGRILLEDLVSLLKEKSVRLVSFVWVNNETGVIQPAAKIIDLIRKHSPCTLIHIDAAQAWGKLPVDLESLQPDYLTASGYKVGSFSGVGLLVLKRGAFLEPLIFGNQELGRRGGTENLVGLWSLGIALKNLNPDLYDQTLRPMRDGLERNLQKVLGGITFNGQEAERVANTSNFTVQGVKTESLLLALDLEGIAVSAGSACSSGALEPSHVLTAMGKTKEEALSSIRVSLGLKTTPEEMETFVNVLQTVVNRLR